MFVLPERERETYALLLDSLGFIGGHARISGNLAARKRMDN